MNRMRACAAEKAKTFLAGYKNLTIRRSGILTCPWPRLGVRLEVDRNLEYLFPYINATAVGAKFFDNPKRIQFLFENAQCTLYSGEIIAAAFKDCDEAHLFSEKLVSYLNGLYARRHAIKPDYRTIEPLSAMKVYKLLPGTNCGRCGLASCLAFAAALSRGQADSGECPGFSEPIAAKAVYPVLDRDGNLASTVELKIPEKQTGSAVPANLLTGRELEVLRLLAQGASNPEISEILFISPHTVKTHVTHIYNKLGINDRAQAAVWASRHSII